MVSCQNCNYRYLNNIKTMSEIVRDELVKPIDKTVWHVEHVIKFPNSRHLQYHGHYISWIDYYAAYLYLGICFALLLYISYILYNRIIKTFVKIRYVSNLKQWISNLKRKLDWYKFMIQNKIDYLQYKLERSFDVNNILI